MGNIIKDMLVVFVVTWLSTMLFYFNLPYGNSCEMSELVQNGVYRWIFQKISGIGYLLYKLIEKITAGITRFCKFEEGGQEHSIINCGAYIGAVWALTSFHEACIQLAVSYEAAEWKFTQGTLWGYITDLRYYWEIMNNFQEIKSIGDFFGALGDTLFAITMFILFTIIHFAIMYGLLSQKVKELNLVEKLTKSETVLSLLDYEPEKLSFRNLPKKLLSNFLDFFNSMGILRNFAFAGVQIAFILGLLVYSFLKARKGDLPEVTDLLMSLLDETNIISTIMSFLISFICGKIVAVAGRFVYKFAPEPVRDRLHSVSILCKERVRYVQEKRDAWSARCDSIFQKTEAIFASKVRNSGDVQRMTLD